MNKKVNVKDVLTILESKSMIANKQEIDVMLDIARTIEKVCRDKGDVEHMIEISECIRAIDYQWYYGMNGDHRTFICG